MIDLLYEALMTPYGVVVETDDPVRLRAKLYTERKKDLSFSSLSFTISPTSPSTELWILKRPSNAASLNGTEEAHP